MGPVSHNNDRMSLFRVPGNNRLDFDHLGAGGIDNIKSGGL